MATPIRWDNINGSGLSEAVRPLQVAQQSFNDSLGGLSQVLNQREAIDQANFANQKANNTNAFLDAVSKYSSPEALRAAQAPGGELDQLRGRLGLNIDANAIRGAADARVASLQQQGQQDITYKHLLADEASNPFKQAFLVAADKGDKVGMANALASYQQANGRDAGTLNREGTMYGQQNTTFANQTAKFKDDLLTNAANRAHMINQDRIGQANADTQRLAQQSNSKMIDFNIKSATDQQEIAARAGRALAAKQGLKEVGNPYWNGIYDGSQSNDLMEAMAKNGIGDTKEDQTNIIRFIDDLKQKGVEVRDSKGNSVVLHDLPMASVEAAIMSSRDGIMRWGWNTGFAKDVKERLENSMQQITIDKNGKETSPIIDNLDAFKQTMRNALDSSVPQYPQRAAKPALGGGKK